MTTTTTTQPSESPGQALTHFDEGGKAHMVDIGAKADTHRVARAAGRIHMKAETLDLVRHGDAGKGDVLGIARIAGIQGAKRTADLIPLAHPIPITHVAVTFELDPAGPAVLCEAVVETRGKTGIEMEALTAVSVALLTIYDMLKAVDRGMILQSVRLLEKSGGRSGHWRADPG